MKSNHLEFLSICIVIVLILQLIVTYGFTYTKLFSFRALIRNLSILIPIVYGVQYVWIPILLEGILETLKYKGYYIDKYIATTYSYNDYVRAMNIKYPILTNLTEGNYDGLLGFDMTDYSQENLKRIRDWCQKTYFQLLSNPSRYIIDGKGEKHDLSIKYKSENQKFDYICKKCEIKPGMKILEIGFGECDFLEYIRSKYGISPVGVSIASEQVKKATSLGFEAYCLDGWNITEEIGKFDLVLQCGNIEHFRLMGEPEEKYKDFCEIIKKVLVPKGKYFITCCHQNTEFDWSVTDRVKAYILWAGNDGAYPLGPDGFTKYAKRSGFKLLYQEDRTFDYYVNEILLFSFLRCDKKCHNVIDPFSLSRALLLTIAAPYFIHTYLCYQPSKDLPVAPFAWEFEPQLKSKGWEFPNTLQYILLQI
jgi:cyclopropane fatty-acyl-phospholipid synthase-like methyltransferase